MRASAMPRSARVLLVIVISMVGSVACAFYGPGAGSMPVRDDTSSAPEMPEVPEVRSAPRVAVVGDSLIATTLGEQHAELTARGYAATVRGNPGKPLTDAWIQAQLAEIDGADIVVVATASNDNLHLAQRADREGLAVARDAYQRQLAEALDLVGAPCTVVVDVREAMASIYRPETAPTTNAAIREVAERARRPVVVASWSSRSAGHDSRDWFVGDELHFIEGAERRDLGVQAYIDVVADGVDECRSRLGA